MPRSLSLSKGDLQSASQGRIPDRGVFPVPAEPFSEALKPGSRARDAGEPRQVRKEAAVSRPLAVRGITRGEPSGGEAGAGSLDRGCAVFYFPHSPGGERGNKIVRDIQTPYSKC